MDSRDLSSPSFPWVTPSPPNSQGTQKHPTGFWCPPPNPTPESRGLEAEVRVAKSGRADVTTGGAGELKQREGPLGVRASRAPDSPWLGSRGEWRTLN